MTNPSEKPIEWLASTKKDLLAFPEEVQRNFGYGLGFVQLGFTPANAKPLHGFGSGVWELVQNHDGNAYRGVYVVRFAEVIYVLHCFQKKSKKGVETPRPDLDMIRRRLFEAQALYQERPKNNER